MCAVVALACGHTSPAEPRKLEDGSYRVDCREPLTRCLAAFERPCPDGFDIVRAHENRKLLRT